MQLEDIRLGPKNITQGLDILRDMKSLKTIGLHHWHALPAAEFWARYEKGEFYQEATSEVLAKNHLGEIGQTRLLCATK
jgi:hypothetical protein